MQKHSPAINTLKVELLSDNSKSYVPLKPNSLQATPFETETFKGICMLMVRTEPLDPNFESFFLGKKRQFEVQVQGKFKREPIGEMFVGAEASQRVGMGIITRTISRGILKLCSTMVNDLHYAFGEPVEEPDHQMPHLVAPLFPTFDKVLVTPKGETPPPLGTPFNEDLEYRKLRTKFKSIEEARVDLETTYSFSVNTSNWSLTNWTLVGIPMVRGMDLRNLIADASVQLVGYEMPKHEIEKTPTLHPQRCLQYMFKLRLTPVEPESMELVELPVGLSDDDLEETYAEGEEALLETPGQASAGAAREEREPFSSQDEDSDPDQYEGAPGEDEHGDSQGHEGGETLFSKWRRSRGSRKKKEGATTMAMGWIRRRINSVTHQNQLTGSVENTQSHDPEEGEPTEHFTKTDYEMESSGDLRFCPACLELNDHRKDGRRRVLYFLPPVDVACGELSVRAVSHDDYTHLHHPPQAPRLRSYSKIATALNLCPIPPLHKNRRLAANEKRRRQIVESYRQLVKANNPAALEKFRAFVEEVSEIDLNFLSGNVPVTHTRPPSSLAQQAAPQSLSPAPPSQDSWEGCVALASSRRHWMEQYLVVNRQEALFYRAQRASSGRGVVSTRLSRVTHRISLSMVLSVHAMHLEEVPIAGFSFFQIETIGRVYYLMVRSDMQLNEWLQVFMTLLGTQIIRSPFVPLAMPAKESEDLMVLPDLHGRVGDMDGHNFLAKSGCWRLDKKRIFNYRRIVFRPEGIPQEYHSLTPLALVEKILRDIYTLSSLDFSQIHAYRWVQFLDLISLLQTLDISALAEDERVCFFLNLYHAMVQHASMVLGPPPAWNYWNAFFNNVTYLFSYEIVSISDVEHNLLRAAMARPSSLSIIPIPLHHFPDLAVTSRDFRLNYCINSGSRSMPNCVPVYKPETLDEQLDQMVRMVVSQVVEVDAHKRVVVLPKVPLHDFAPPHSSVSPQDCLRAIACYLAKDDQSTLLRLLSDHADSFPSIRFKNPSLKCQTLHLLSSGSELETQEKATLTTGGTHLE